ncbi:apolipoprotein B-100-like [Salarias fasciatus]|uniref:apolipoprotein B-100-like n=1 Tax=Salarias fasciatus TaxID=181472 RepID=UPI001176E97D|nr:apolipoprotein B-100-like [Salarias fasciatus]
MGSSKLCLLLLLVKLTLTYAQEEHASCLLSKSYKAHHKYEYLYEAESLNAINGASHLKNGPKATCKVEIEVPQTCSFIFRTTGCSLSEVIDVDAEGNPVFGSTPTSNAFAAEMERYPVKVVFVGASDVKLYPEDDETTNILNIKRSIISALTVPLMEGDKNKDMPTIHGMCKTQYTVSSREETATDIRLTRDLSRCSKFVPIKDHTSPLALISGMHYPLAQLIRSSQICNYRFDNEEKHITSSSCTEKHILIPFSHKGEYGVTNVGKQHLTLVQVSPIDDKVFFHSDNVKGLPMETVEDKSAVQDKDAALNLLRELATLSEADGEKRAHLFHMLVSMVRGMKMETLSPAIPKALEVSRVLTYQVLAQCGTPQCSSAIMQILRSFDSASLEVDASVFALGLMSNPSELLINDMLEMAKYKSSKPIMYALSNVVKRFYKAEEKLTPEIFSVAEFMAGKLGDCSGDNDETFMTLRVIGNMAPALVNAGPALRGAVMQCVNQPAASPAVQQAAIQVFRLTPAPEEVREVFMQVLLDGASPVQKRIAAYLVLMKDPQTSELTQLVNALPTEQDQQVKSFVISHLTNILSSTVPETLELRQRILEALQGNDIEPTMDPTKFSRNYKIGSLEGNMLFDSSSYLPKEVMLDMTLKAFGFDIDMMEIGMEGKGFEPTVEALFGDNGFFPDTVMKTIYFVSENMPEQVSEMLQNIVPALKRNRMKRQAHMNFMRDIGRNLNKLVRDLKDAQSPEAMVYMRLLGNELGYLRTNEMEEMAYSLVMMIDSMFKMFPTDIMKALMTKADNTIFAHYIFMDNEFFLPTMTGVPLRVALSGTFTPGLKGGLQMARDMSKITFMPSAGVEFVTQVGSYFPEYVNSGLEMQTNIFHESGLRAEIAMARDNIKLTIPAPTTPTKLIKVTNSLVAVTGSEVHTIPSILMDKIDVSECTPVFAGMKYCTALQYTDAYSHETGPYFPFTGDSKFAVELHPTGEVTEYTATVAYELLKEGEEGRQKVDAVKFILRAEGAEPTEAMAVLKYNRRKNVVTADIQIPDYDVEAGLRLGVVDGNTKGKGTHSISLDLINKNIPQLSIVGRANLKDMKEGMLQVQLLVPSINADATITANMKRDEELELQLRSIINFLETTSAQTIDIKYDAKKVEVNFKSDMNSEIVNILPNVDVIKKFGDDLLELPIGETDMKVHQILKEFVETTNKHLESYGAFRVPDMPEISLPETLFLNVDTKAVYSFNPERFTIVLPLPLGGKSAEELNFPPALTTPQMSVPQLGLEIVSIEVPVPDFVIPESFSLSVPYFGKAEFSTVMRSNVYEMEASVMAGKDDMKVPKYSAKFDVKGTSPIDILSVTTEGSAMLDITESIKAELKSSLTHKFVEASFSIIEDAAITDKVSLKSNSKVEVTSPLGLNVVLEHTGMAGINTEEISADNNFEGSFKAGPIFGKTVSTQTFAIFPLRPEAKIDSSVQLDSTILKAQNTIAATFANGEVSVVSNTNAYEDVLTHVAELSFKDGRLSLKSDANALALGMKIRNQAEASTGLSDVTVRMETNADQSENRVYSLLTASFDSNGLALNSDANMKIFENEATHKAALTLNKDGLATSGTTTLQSIVSLENTFSGGLDATKATLSITNKGAMQDIKIDNANTLTITLSSLDFDSKADVIVSEYATYTHDITFDMKPFTASANLKNNLQLLAAEFINEAQLQAELYKMDLTGSLKAIYAEEELKHTYQVSYADMTATAKCSTTGKLFGTHMNQNTEVEIIGLAARITNDARFNSQPIRFDHTIRCSIVPFDFNLDAIFNGDGDLTMYGKHSAQLYGKFLLRAQPLAFASSHECRASVTQELINGISLNTIIDHNIDTVVGLQEQKVSLKMSSKLNDHVFKQDVNIYNTLQRAGIEISETMLTNILNTDSTENQEFAISGFLKYDKSMKSHIIRFPLIDSLPVFLDNLKELVVRAAEALQEYINSDEIRARIAALPQYVNDIVAEVNIEDKIVQLKQYFNDFTQDFVISMDDVEASLKNLKATVERLLSDLTVYIQQFVGMVKDAIASSTFPETLVQNFQDLLTTINEDYDVKAMVVNMIDTFRDMISQFDLEKLKGSSIAFLSDIDAKYEIKAKLETIMSYIRETIDSFDMATFVAEMQSYFTSTDFKARIEELVNQIPTDTLTEIIDYVKRTIQSLDLTDKLNTFYAKIREMIAKFEIEQKAQAVLEKVVELIKQFKIEETTSALLKMVKDVDVPAKLMQVFQDVIDYLKTREVDEIILQLNMYIETILEKLKSLDYNNFLDYANNLISDSTIYLNEFIRTLEIPQKLEATRDFVNLVLSVVQGFVESLREVRIAEVKDIFDQVVLNNLKTFAEFMKERIATLDIKTEITSFLDFVGKNCTNLLSAIIDTLTSAAEMIKTMMPEQKIFNEIQQIIDAVLAEMKKVEVKVPSFTIPLTDLVVPSLTISIDALNQFECPTQLDIPMFSILGFYTVPATTISIDDIKQTIIDLIDFILNFEMEMLNIDATFGHLTTDYFPALPKLSVPEISFTELSFPALPHVPAEKLVNVPLQLPTLQMPIIPSDLRIPEFGKLSYEVKVSSPIYSIRNAAEVQNSLDVDENPQLSAFLTTQGTSPSFAILNFNMDCTARIGMPKSLHVIAAETFILTHDSVSVDHHASVTLADFAVQASAKTTMKAKTEPYNAEFLNEVFLSTQGGLSTSIDTTYKHELNLFGLTGETSFTQKSVARQEGTTLTITCENGGASTLNSYHNTHKSDLQITVNPSSVKLSFTGDTDAFLFKTRQALTADVVVFSYVKLDVRSETEGPAIKSSRFEGSLNANLHDSKFELKATHSSDVFVPWVIQVSGELNNAVDFVVSPSEVLFSFENKGNTKVNFDDTLTAKIDLQNDYSASLRPDKQQINIVALTRFNEHKQLWNLTVENNENEFAILGAAEGKMNLEILTKPITISEYKIPFVDLHTPGISNLDLYDRTGLKYILTTPEQIVDADIQIIYHKSQGAPLVDLMGLIQIPSLDDLITKVSFKSAIITLNVNAGLYSEEDLVIRLEANTGSVFEGLKAKLDGTSSLTTKREIKLANSLSLENRHIEGTHYSTFSVSTDTFETAVSVTTAGKIDLPVFNLEARQSLVADTKTKANAASTLKMNGQINIPLLKTSGKAEADHSLKLEGTLEDISIEYFTKANMDGIILEDFLVLGVLDNEATLYLNNDGLRSTSKVTGGAKLNKGLNRLFGMDVNNYLATEASLSRVFAELKYNSNNVANLLHFNTNGKHTAQATIVFEPTSTLTADIEIDMSQPTNLGEFKIFEKTVAEVTSTTQKMSSNAKFISPLYNFNIEAEIDGIAPVSKVIFKSSSTSPIAILEYDLESLSTINFDDDGITVTEKAVFSTTDFTMDVQQTFSHTLSESYLTMNVDITSLAFTDMNLRYAVRKDGISATVSVPTTGFLGLQLHSRSQSQMNARLYGRYASDPGKDVDIVTIRVSQKDADKSLNLKLVFNMDAPEIMLSGLQEKLPAITSCVSNYAEKYRVFSYAAQLKEMTTNLVDDAYTFAHSHAPDLSQVSVLFRNTAVQFQRTVQLLLDAAIKVLRDTKVKLPGSDEMTPLTEVLKKFTTSITIMVEKAIHMLTVNIEYAYTVVVEMASEVEVTMPIGDVMAGAKVIKYCKESARDLIDFIVQSLKNAESIDMLLERLGDTLKFFVDKTQAFVDNDLKSDMLDAIAVHVNALYDQQMSLMKSFTEYANSIMTADSVNEFISFVLNSVRSKVNEFSSTVTDYIQQAPAQYKPYLKVKGKKLEINI